MSTHSTPSHGHHPSTHDLERGNHQEDAIDFSGILKAGAGLTVVTILTYLAVWGVYVLLANTIDASSANRQYPMAIGQENRLPPEPRLQTDPKGELKSLRTAEADVLDHYGWVDRNAGIVRIPIENAMKLTVERGLASRQTASGAPGAPAAAAPTPAAPVATAPAPAPAAEPAHPQEHK